jgi:cytochrome P450
MLMAGHESTSVALTWAWYLLDRHPNDFDALQAELDTVVGDRRVEVTDLTRLPTTSMIVDETLRLYPPAWSTTRTPLRDDEIGGRRIPRGKFVIVSPYMTHRHPAFWEDPESFRPERFREGIPSGADRFAYFPFGGGPRQCMGAQFALMEAKIVLATLARRFRPCVVPGHVVGIDPQVTLRPLGGMPMRLAS